MQVRRQLSRGKQPQNGAGESLHTIVIRCCASVAAAGRAGCNALCKPYTGGLFADAARVVASARHRAIVRPEFRSIWCQFNSCSRDYRLSDDFNAEGRNGHSPSDPAFRQPPYRRPAFREPAFNVPGVVLGIIAVLCVIHAVRMMLPAEDDSYAMLMLAFIPARLSLWFDPSLAQGLFEAAFNGGGLQMALTRFVLTEGSAPWSVLTYAALHGSWMHLAFNAVWLLAFGTPVARRFGTVRFLVLFIAAAVAGSLFYWVMRPLDVTPMVGASGAISGVMAAAARFVFGPGKMAMFGRSTSILYAPAQPLVGLLENKQALGFIIAWLVINLIAGFASGAFGADGEIAWEAHIGGFLAGLVLFMPLDPIPRAPRHPRA